jgi:transcriptional regulator with XRE-family HTH domain
LEGEELAARHIALRERVGLTQEQEAKMAGVSPTTISGIESGKIRRPHLKTLLKIARALGVGVGELRESESGKVEAPPSQQTLFNSVEEQRRHWSEEAEKFILQNEGLLSDPELTYVVSSKLLRRSVNRLLEVNEAIKAANQDEDFSLTELNDMQVAFGKLQNFSSAILANHEERFGEQDEYAGKERRRLRALPGGAEGAA